MPTIDLSSAPPNAVGAPGVKPGDVYRKSGGPGGIWVIVAVSASGDYCYVIGFDTEGNPVTASRYGTHYFERKQMVGRMPNWETKWEIEWC